MKFRDEVISTLRRHGSDTTLPHVFEFHVVAATKTLATLAAETCKKSRFTPTIQPYGKHWICIAERTMVPEKADLDDNARFFREVADAIGGYFDGWEASPAMKA